MKNFILNILHKITKIFINIIKKFYKKEKQIFGGDPEFYKLLDIMGKIYQAKNSDYAGGDPLGNFYRCERGGVSALNGIFARITDKDSRIETLMMKRNKGISPAVKDEPLAKTLIDRAIYSLLMVLVLKRLDGFKLEKLLDEITIGR